MFASTSLTTTYPALPMGSNQEADDEVFNEASSGGSPSFVDETKSKDEPEPFVDYSGKVPHFGKRPRNPAVLILWIERHPQNPYPSKAEKTTLAHYAGMTQRQLNDWFANARRNIKKIGYAAWKEKHPSYSAHFSVGGHLVHQSTVETGAPMCQHSTADPPMQMATLMAPSTASLGPPRANGLSIAAAPLKYGRCEDLIRHNPAGMNQRGFHPYLLQSQAQIMSSGVGALQQVYPIRGFNLSQPGIHTLNVATSRSNLLNQHQFSSDITPWVNTPQATSEASITSKPKLHLLQNRCHVKPYSSPIQLQRSSQVDSNTTPSVTENSNSETGTRAASSNTASTAEATWEPNLPQSTATHHQQQLFSDFTTVHTSPDIETSWAPTTTLYQLTQTYH